MTALWAHTPGAAGKLRDVASQLKPDRTKTARFQMMLERIWALLKYAK